LVSIVSPAQHSSCVQSVDGKERFIAAVAAVSRGQDKTMLTSIEGGRSYPHDPALRGFQILYHSGELNRCPGCGRSHWYIGRLSAECGFCGTALALAETARTGAGLFRTVHPVRQDQWDIAA
jgi:hypothetical protein